MEQRSKEWLEARQGKVTASMVGAILGLSPYMTRHDAMRAMVREVIGEPREFTGNVATEWGTYNEAGAVMEFRMETGLGVESAPFVAAAGEDWAGASPDGWTSDGGGLEVKCPYGLRAAEAPVAFKLLAEQPHYEAQVQFTLWVTGRPHWNFYQWCPAGTAHEIILPDQAWRDENLPRLRQFHAEFVDEVNDNADEHRGEKRPAIDTPESLRMVTEWDEIAEMMERLAERKRDLLDDMVKLAGGKNALLSGRKLTLTSRQGPVSYAKVVKEHCPKVDLESYRGKPSSFWGLR